MERFWNKVDKSGDCWEWTAYRNSCGYGVINMKGETVLAHRKSLELDGFDVPSGMCVLHRCDNPACVNPDHLFLGTHQENMADMAKKGRAARGIGSLNGNARLSETDIPRIRDMLRVGATTKDIGSVFGVTKEAIQAISSGRNWEHVV